MNAVPAARYNLLCKPRSILNEAVRNFSTIWNYRKYRSAISTVKGTSILLQDPVLKFFLFRTRMAIYISPLDKVFKLMALITITAMKISTYFATASTRRYKKQRLYKI